MSPKQRARLQAKEKQHKIDSHFVDPHKHTQLGEAGARQTTEARLKKELPFGWHLGHTAEGRVYFWHDSGAKQLHFPVAPSKKRLLNANITPQQFQHAASKIAAINAWGKEWGASADPPAGIAKLVQPSEEDKKREMEMLG